MKKMFVLLAAVLFTASSFAAPVSEKVKSAFSAEFKNATNAKWATTGGLYLVTFQLNNEVLKAWYTEDGAMEAVQRSVSVNQMNLLAARSTESLAAENAVVTSITEINQGAELYYVVTTETATHSNTYKVLTDGSKSRISRKKK